MTAQIIKKLKISNLVKLAEKGLMSPDEIEWRLRRADAAERGAIKAKLERTEREIHEQDKDRRILRAMMEETPLGVGIMRRKGTALRRVERGRTI